MPLSPDMEKKVWDGLRILKKPCITRYIIKRHLAFLTCSNNYLKAEQERRHLFGVGTGGINLELSLTMQFVQMRADAEAKAAHSNSVGIEHVFLGLLKLAERRADDLFMRRISLSRR